MISTHFVINFAFCIGALFAFYPLYKKIKQILCARLDKIKQEVMLASDIQKQSKLLLDNIATQSYDTEKFIAEILKKAREEHNSIITSHKNEIEHILEKHLDVAVKKISDQVSTMTQSLKLSTIDIAVSAIQELIKESNHHKQDNSGAISTLDRDLRKKLH